MNAVVRARVDEKVKQEAAKVLSAIGLTVSDAFRMMVTRTAAEKKLPFEPLAPNKKTLAAIKASRVGKGRRVGTVADLMKELNSK